MHRRGVGRCKDDGGVEGDDALQRLAGGKDAPGLVVLRLFAHEEEAYTGIVYHELYLLLRAGGIEGYGDGPYAPGAKVGEEVLHGVLREHAQVLLHPHP